MARVIPSQEWLENEVCHVIIFEAYEMDLEEELRVREQQRKAFTENELWKLADCCLSALAKMQYYKIPHTGVSTGQIFKVGDGYKLNYIQSATSKINEISSERPSDQYRRNIRELGKVLLRCSNLGQKGALGKGTSPLDPLLGMGELDRLELGVVAAGKKYSRAWSNFLAEITLKRYVH